MVPNVLTNAIMYQFSTTSIFNCTYDYVILDGNADRDGEEILNEKFKEMGCFKDGEPRAIGGTAITFDPKEAIKKCYEKAGEQGNEYFALQNDNECFTHADAGGTYMKYGPANDCKDGRDLR